MWLTWHQMHRRSATVLITATLLFGGRDVDVAVMCNSRVAEESANCQSDIQFGSWNLNTPEFLQT